ncbi:MAG TPA: PAS domain-containing protein, partial [Gemmatimonadales bacterium]|nr:PAS domain-containing protein [Gemmatimonadales bacterium]
CPITRTLRDGQVQRVADELFFRKDGSSFHAAYTCTPMRGPVGEVNGAVISFRDITDDLRTQGALQEQAGLLANAERIARMGRWNMDVVAGRLTWSDATCELFGISPAEFRGTFEQFHGFILPEDRPGYDLVHAQVSPAEPLIDTEYRIRRPDGAVRWMYERGEVEYDAAGRQVRRLGMVMDVTAERQARAELSQNASLLRIAGRVAQIGGWRIDLPGRIITWSDEICAMHDLPAGHQPTVEEGLGYFVPEARPVIERHLKACIEEGTPYDLELEKTTAKGRRIFVRTLGEAVRDADGHIIRVQGAFQDITDRKVLEHQLLRSQRMESIGTLAGGIAHDLNNILTPILMSISLLKEPLTDEERAETIETIEGSAQKGAELVRQVLAFARGVEGRRVAVDVARLVREMGTFANDTFLKSIQVRTEVTPDLPAALGDPTQLHQVLLNLSVNARDAMPFGGILIIAAAACDVDPSLAARHGGRVGPHVMVSVSDTGTGMDAAMLDRIFEPFFTTKPHGQGTGLGLSTSLAIVRSHGGFFHVRSVRGKGSTFEVYLPVAGTGPASPTPVPVDRAPQGRGQLILVVDDEAAVREITRRILAGNGYRVVLAADGAEAVQRYAAEGGAIAGVVTDMMMPVMDGLATIHALRAIEPRVPIVAVSGLAEASDLGGDQRTLHLAKPYTAVELLRTLDTALRTP